MYYVENSHPPIISKDVFEAAKQLLKKRKTVSHTKKTSYPLSKLLICPICKHPFRRISANSDIPYWVCGYSGRGRTPCRQIRVDEQDVYTALLRMVNILRNRNEQILIPMIVDLETVQSRANGTQHKVYAIDAEIATLSNKILALAKLQTQGILDCADFAAKNQELANKVTRLRAERSRLLRQNEENDHLIRLRELSELLADINEEVLVYDETFINPLIEHITVKSETEIEIRLHGGLVLTEHLPKRKRR